MITDKNLALKLAFGPTLCELAEDIIYSNEKTVDTAEGCFLGYCKDSDTYYMGFETFNRFDDLRGSAMVTAKLGDDHNWYDIKLDEYNDSESFFDYFLELAETLEVISKHH